MLCQFGQRGVLKRPHDHLWNKDISKDISSLINELELTDQEKEWLIDGISLNECPFKEMREDERKTRRQTLNRALRIIGS